MIAEVPMRYLLVLILALAAFALALLALAFRLGASSLAARLVGIEAQIRDLKRRLQILERRETAAVAGAAEPEAAGASLPAATEAAPGRSPSAGEGAPPVVQAAFAPPGRPETPRAGAGIRPAAGRPALDLEQRIGARWATWVGIVAIIFAVGLLLRWTFENDLIGPTARVALGLISGVALLLGGLALHRGRRMPYLSEGLAGGGLGILYLSWFAAYHFYGFIDSGAAFGLMFLVTVLGSAVSIVTARRATAVLALLGGLLTPILASTGETNERGLLGYLIVLNLLALAVARYRDWPALNRLGWAGSVVLLLPTFARQPHPPDPPARLLLLTALFLIFLAAPLLHAWRERRRAGAIDLVLVIGNAAAYFGMVYVTLEEYRPEAEAPWALALAVLYVLVAALHGRRVPGDEAAVDLHLGNAAVLLTLAVPLALDGPWVTLAWAAMGVVLLSVAPRLAGATASVLGGIAVLLLAAARIAWFDPGWFPADRPVLNLAFATHLMVVAALALGGIVARRLAPSRGHTGIAAAEVRGFLWFVAAALLALLLWREPTGTWPATLLTLEMLALAGLARWQGDPTFGYGTPLLAGIVVARIWVADHRLAREAAVDLINGPLLLRVAACAAFAIAGGWLARSPSSSPAGRRGRALKSAAGLLLLQALSQGWYQHEEIELDAAFRFGQDELAQRIRFRLQVGMSILWTLYAAGALAGGFARRTAAMRYAALALFGVVIVKVFLVDLAELEAIYRILSFLVLGLVLLGVSALYQKLRSSPGAAAEQER